ncbi:MAG TPA: ferritin-like domain-containing protein [Blastocatellia bacterium]|nr:ferritin-like domain-containing protein [Blastocatellia bacterium]
MNLMTVTYETGAKTMPIGMTVTGPESELSSSELMSFAEEMQSNSILLANLISAFAAHERGGVHLYRTAMGLTQFQEWRRKYEEFLTQTVEHVRILSELTIELGGDPGYVSPQARMTEFMNTKLMESVLLDGSVDGLTRELTILEAVLLAERKCHANWDLLSELCRRLPASDDSQAIERAVTQVKIEEDEHVRWAQQTWRETLLTQLTPSAVVG